VNFIIQTKFKQEAQQQKHHNLFQESPIKAESCTVTILYFISDYSLDFRSMQMQTHLKLKIKFLLHFDSIILFAASLQIIGRRNKGMCILLHGFLQGDLPY
jgi:hypothetical protein